MKTPDIDLDELNKLKEDNFKERLEFVEKYAEWMKKHPRKADAQQKKLIG